MDAGLWTGVSDGRRRMCEDQKLGDDSLGCIERTHYLVASVNDGDDGADGGRLAWSSIGCVGASGGGECFGSEESTLLSSLSCLSFAIPAIKHLRYFLAIYYKCSLL